MNLMHGESILLESASRKLVLTTHRIRYETESLGQAHVKSIMLENVSSCALERTSLPILLLFSAVCLLIGLTAGVMAAAVTDIVLPSLIIIGLGIAFAGFFAISYLFTRYQVVAFGSGSGAIQVDVSELRLESARHLIDATEAAKNARYLKSPSP